MRRKETLDATDITSPGTHTPEAEIQLSNSVTRATVKEPISARTQQRVCVHRSTEAPSWENRWKQVAK